MTCAWKMEGKPYALVQIYLVFCVMKKYFSIVKRAYLWLFIALSTTVVSWVLFIFNAELSEEFTGGVSITFKGEAKNTDLKSGLADALQEKGFPKLNISIDEEQNQTKIKINGKLENDEKVNELSAAVPAYLIESQIVASDDEIIEQAVVGPSVGKYMRSTAGYALWLGLIAMMVYMIFSFGTIRKSIAPEILATIVLLSSVLSVSLPAGAYGLWMTIDNTIQIDTVFIIAILTVIGYGINDVIIIFDRVRENMSLHAGKKNFSYSEVMDDSIWQTFKRSIGTSLSTLLVLIAMFMFGTGVIQRFSFTVGVGVIASFLSSVFVAIPSAYLLIKLTKKGTK